MPGGDLYYWLEYYDTFTEEQARFYLAETVLALQALHELGYIHRDLKPDNMLLDAQGHLKLADFGSCVRLDSQGRYFCTSPIGTPDYISPEMLNCQSKAGFIGPACDWWALGVIAFEMLFGETAFYGQSLVETYSRILGYEKSLKIPTDTEISAIFESLIRDFLRGPNDRLGAKCGAEEVKKHPFFNSIDWPNLRSTIPPIQPVVTSDVDTSNINFDESELLGADSKLKGDSSNSSSGSPANLPRSAGAFATKKNTGSPAYFTGDNLAFAGFTFNGDDRRNSESMAKTPLITNGDAHTAEIESALAESRAKLSAAEKQAAVDKIAMNEAQRRLEDMKAELATAKAELERLGDENKTQVACLQSERDMLNDRIKKLQLELITTAEDLENERKALAIAKEELVAAKSDPPPVTVVNDARQRASVKENLSLEVDLEVARQQACRAEAELVSSRRLHAEEMGELSDQLQAEKTFSQLYKSKFSEAEAELESLRTSLASTQAICKELKERNFGLESDLAVSKVDLEGLKKSYETDLKEANIQATRLKDRVNGQATEILTMTEQRKDLMRHCKTLEESVSTLTDQLQALRKENKIQKLKIDQTVTKLFEVASVAPAISGKTRKSSEAIKVATLEKQLRNAEHRHQKEIADLQSTLNRLKTDNEEKAKAMAELTDHNRHLEQELEKVNVQVNTLYECYATKSAVGEEGKLSSSSSLGRIAKESASPRLRSEISHSLENLSSIPEYMREMQPSMSPYVEGVCDFPEKVRGKKKLAWTPKFAVICPFSVSFYSSKVQRDQIGSVPCEEIPIHRIFSVRPGTVLDLTYATEDDASRLICIISDEIAQDSGVNDADKMSIMSGTFGPSSSCSNHISWQGHSFQPMTFRIMTAICEVCRRSCSDLRSPPPALECIRCRMRIHRTHVENHEKFVVCPNTVRQWIIRAPTPADRNAWISCINQLKKDASAFCSSDCGLTHSPSGSLTRTAGSGAPATPLSGTNTVRYRSMRNFGGFTLKDIASRRSVAVTFPRHNSSSGVTGSSTPGVVHPHQRPTLPNIDGQHDL
nr:hypothetical transcript [Hymenolepis microstoma]